MGFVGAAFLRFQANYVKGGMGIDFGMFGLGEELLSETGEVCQPGAGCRKWPVHCLTAKLSWLPGSKAHRAQAVASAWGGSVEHVSMCSNERRLQAGSVGTKLACQIRADAASEGAGAVSVALNSDAEGRCRSTLAGASRAIRSCKQPLLHGREFAESHARVEGGSSCLVRIATCMRKV